MKKLLIVALATVLTAALVVPASALENIFGGYWRTRFITQQNFSGEDGIIPGAPGDLEQVDTRTRFYYTAVLNDNLKLVSKFETDAVWGDNTTYGDIGTDGLNFEIKHAYADFNLGPVNAKVGSQGITLNRGFLFDDDFAGTHVMIPAGPANISLVWIKAYEGGKNNNIADVDYYVIKPAFSFGPLSIAPYLTYVRSNDADAWGEISAITTDATLDMYYLSLDVDFTTDAFAAWFTGIMQLGNYELVGEQDVDFKGYLLAAGATIDLGMLDFHGQTFYATGNKADDAERRDVDLFFVPKGQSYYWSEIMGYGIFDEQCSSGSPGDQIGNIWAANLGTKVTLNDKLSIKGDVWYAQLVEDDAFGQDKLGTEVDIVVTYELVENLKLDLVGAYLFADDATSTDGTNNEDPYEVGARLSLSF